MNFITALSIIALWLVAFVGWFFNLFNVIGNFTGNEPFTPLVIGQLIGVVIGPIGSILGWVV